MKRKTIITLIIINVILIPLFPTLFALEVVFGLPFLFIYFLYRLIKGLMKYHHDLKSGNENKNKNEETTF